MKGRELVSSRLIPMLVEFMESRERVVVLDVGAGSQATLDFLSGYNAVIHFVDLLSSEVCSNPPEEPDSGSASESFKRHFELPEGQKFDVCLFWDVFHRMDLQVLQGLSRALAPHIDSHTLGYGFGTLHGQLLDGARYGIGDRNHLSVRPIEVAQPFNAHSQKQLSDNFTCLSIQRSTLLREGRLELLYGKG